MDKSIQESIDHMLSTILDGNAQEYVMEIYQQVANLPNFCLYLFVSLNNESLDFPARIAASHLLRHNISKILDDTVKQALFENIETSLYQCLHCDDSKFQASICALISEIILHYGDSLFPNLNQFVNELLSNDETLIRGFALIKELASNSYFIEGDYIMRLKDMVLSGNFELAMETVSLSVELSLKQAKTIKDIVIIPLLKDENVIILSDFILVKIIEIVDNFLSLHIKDELEINDEEMVIFIQFLIFSVTSNNNGLAIPAVDAFMKTPMEFNEELVIYLYKKLSQDDDLDPLSFSTHCYSLLTEMAKIDPENIATCILQMISQDISSTDLQSYRSAFRALSFLSHILEDKSELIPIVTQQITDNPNPLFRKEAILCGVEFCKTDEELCSPIFEEIFPLINDPNEEIRMQVLRSVPVLFERVELDPDAIFPVFLATIQERVNEYEGVLLLETLLSFIKNTENLDSSSEFSSILECILAIFIGIDDNDPKSATCIEIMDFSISSYPSLLEIIEYQGFTEKLDEILSKGEFLDDYFASLIVQLLSSSLRAQNELEIDTYQLLFHHYTEISISLLHFNLTRTIIKIWEYLSIVIDSPSLSFDNYNDTITQFIQEDTVSELDFNPDLIGNYAYFLFHYFHKFQMDNAELLQCIFQKLKSFILSIDDIEDLENIICCMLLILQLLNFENINSASELIAEEQISVKIQQIILQIESEEDAPEECIMLCAKFKNSPMITLS